MLQPKTYQEASLAAGTLLIKACVEACAPMTRQELDTAFPSLPRQFITLVLHTMQELNMVALCGNLIFWKGGTLS